MKAKELFSYGLLSVILCCSGLLGCSDSIPEKDDSLPPLTEDSGNGDSEIDEKPDTPIDPEEYPNCTIVQQATLGTGIDIVLVGEGFAAEDKQPGGRWEAVQDTVQKYMWRYEPFKSFKEYFNVYATATAYNGPSIRKLPTKDNAVTTDLMTIDNAPQPTKINKLPVFTFAYENTPVKKLKGTPKNMFVMLVLNTDDAYGGWCTTEWWVDREGWGACLVPAGLFHNFLYSYFTHEFMGHGFARCIDEYVYGNNRDVEFPQDQVDSNCDTQRRLGIHWNATLSSNPDDEQHFVNRNWAWMVKNSYRGVGTYEGAWTYGKGAWRATYNSTMVGEGKKENYEYINPVQRELILHRIYELSGMGDQYKFPETFIEYDERNEQYDRDFQIVPD